MTKTPPLDTIPKSGTKSPQSRIAAVGNAAPPADRLTLTIPKIRPAQAVLAIINPDPGRKVMEAVDAMVAEVLPAIQADHHLKHMLLRLKHLVDEGEGWAAMDERKLVNGQVCMIVTDYLRRKKVRRFRIEARHHVEARRLTVFVSVFHGRTEATRILEITPQ
jgi:hypothetical protein